ncbi:ester cyclase [Mycobacterium sp.]|uniref:ester cyclase n=1 Tax=Mycobacterium sp. TaxID=1785 RepID=UPI0039C8CEFD
MAEGATAVSYGRSTGTHRGEFIGIPATERSFDVLTCGTARFADGQAVERRGLSDNRSGWADPAGLVDRQLVCQQLGECECARWPVVLAQ